MRVAELIMMLQRFPPELEVFFCPDEARRLVIAPQDAFMNLVHPALAEVIDDDEPAATVPDGYVDSLVIYGATQAKM
jgi:hypothetical protein